MFNVIIVWLPREASVADDSCIYLVRQSCQDTNLLHDFNISVPFAVTSNP